VEFVGLLKLHRVFHCVCIVQQNLAKDNKFQSRCALYHRPEERCFTALRVKH
jgi:hypothetical protein